MKQNLYGGCTFFSAPTFVSEVTNIGAYNLIKKRCFKACSVIVSIDCFLNVLGKRDCVIRPLKHFLKLCKKRGVIPIIRIEDMGVAKAFISQKFLQKTTDMSIIGKDLAVLSYIREKVPHIRAVADFTEQSVNISNAFSVMTMANKAFANAVLISQNDCDRQVVDYIQSRAKTVWVKAENCSDFALKKLISDGVYGIVGENVTDIDGALSDYSTEIVPLSRSFLNIGHRGLCYECNENSMDGLISAYENGSTHLEVDAHLTADKQIIIMHDDRLNRTTNYTGDKKICQMTLQEIRQYKIIKTYDGRVTGKESDIPTIDELFSYFKGKNVIFAFEVKSKQPDFHLYFKQKLDEYNFYDQLYIISFECEQLKSLKENIPALNLALLERNGIVKGDKLTGDGLKKLAALNSVIDFYYEMPLKITKLLSDRGIMSFYWTYQRNSDVNYAIKTGCYGVTTNSANTVKHYAKELVLSDGAEVYAHDLTEINAKQNSRIKLYFKDYTGKLDSGEYCPVFVVESYKDYSLVIFKRIFKTEDISYTLYSQPIKVIQSEK